MAEDVAELLREAASLKREKRYDEAVVALRRALKYTTPPMWEARLLLPMYLQLAGRADEGWRALNLLVISEDDIFAQTRVAEEMAKFLRNEGNHKRAVVAGAWALCMARQRDIIMLHEIEQMYVKGHQDEVRMLKQGLPAKLVFSSAPKAPDGAPILATSYPPLQRRIETGYGEEKVRATVRRDLAKLNLTDKGAALVADLAAYIQSPLPYDMSAVSTIVARHLP